jgi:hypothetical protein
MSGGLFSRTNPLKHDRSVLSATNHVVDAERKETVAKSARLQARDAVHNARKEVKQLEREAAQE